MTDTSEAVKKAAATVEAQLLPLRNMYQTLTRHLKELDELIENSELSEEIRNRISGVRREQHETLLQLEDAISWTEDLPQRIRQGGGPLLSE